MPKSTKSSATKIDRLYHHRVGVSRSEVLEAVEALPETMAIMDMFCRSDLSIDEIAILSRVISIYRNASDHASNELVSSILSKTRSKVTQPMVVPDQTQSGFALMRDFETSYEAALARGKERMRIRKILERSSSK